MKRSESAGARSRARELALQALYQAQIAGHDKTELFAQFRERPEYARVDQPYFDSVLAAICDGRVSLQAGLAAFTDRPIEQLDPVELGILLIGYHELESRADVPYRVVINEAVNLAKRFGAVDGHKYINAVLDRAVRSLRPAEDS